MNASTFAHLQVATGYPGKYQHASKSTWISLQWHKHLEVYYMRKLHIFKKHISNNWSFKDKAEGASVFPNRQML